MNWRAGTLYEESCCSVGSFCLNFYLLFLYFLSLQISLHCLAVHFVIACIKLSSVGGEKGGSRGERMITITKACWSFLSSEGIKNIFVGPGRVRGSFVHLIFSSKTKIENRCQFLIFQFLSSCIMDKHVSKLFLPFFPVNKYEKINTQLLFSTVNIKMIIEPWIF